MCVGNSLDTDMEFLATVVVKPLREATTVQRIQRICSNHSHHHFSFPSIINHRKLGTITICPSPPPVLLLLANHGQWNFRPVVLFY